MAWGPAGCVPCRNAFCYYCSELQTCLHLVHAAETTLHLFLGQGLWQRRYFTDHAGMIIQQYVSVMLAWWSNRVVVLMRLATTTAMMRKSNENKGARSWPENPQLSCPHASTLSKSLDQHLTICCDEFLVHLQSPGKVTPDHSADPGRSWSAKCRGEREGPPRWRWPNDLHGLLGPRPPDSWGYEQIAQWIRCTWIMYIKI